MLLYAPADTPRLRYVLRFLSDYYGHPFELTSHLGHYQAASGPKGAYTGEGVEHLLFRPCGLIEEQGVRAFAPEVRQDAAFPVLFPEREGAGFDLFSAIFYLLSRYEEYSGWKADEYGRYDYRASTAAQNHFLNRPLINEWLEAFRPRLLALGQPIADGPPPRRWIPTYDIDIAWSYLGKGWKRNLGGALRDGIFGDRSRLWERFQVIRGQKSDPYDAYSLIEELHRAGERPHFFFHCGAERNRYDKAIPATYPPWQDLVRRLAQVGDIGLHPSWASGGREALLAAEQRTLEAALGEEVKASRQHYIRFRLPGTFRRLIAAGIRADYSMGYGSVNGYRASVAHPFRWYDLEKEAETELMLYPFAWMDANAHFEQGMSPESGIEELMGYWEGLKQCGGILITIAHNTFLGTDPLFRGWREAYAAFSALAGPRPRSGSPSGLRGTRHTG